MKLQNYVLIGLFIIFAGSLAFSKISFACYTGPEYQVDCCELGYWDMGAYCCKTWEDCFQSRTQNCRKNSYRFTHPCDSNPDNCLSEEALLNDKIKTDTLRRFRDEVLSTTPVGQEYIRLYYQWSPFIVQAMEEDAEFKEKVREFIEQLLPMIEAMVQ